jgi:trans-2,3-dihydro-3-hydroxyanthranilate isomerase
MTIFHVYDVFTKQAFGGNQLAVIPDASTLPEADLQAIAREFNFSETTFVYPAANPENTARVRIFTPTNEIPFAGHPTIGTAISIAESTGQTNLILELGVGPIPCQVTLGKPSSAVFSTSVPLKIYAEVPPKTSAACIGLAEKEIVVSTHIPQIASVGLPFTLVELASDEDLRRATPITDQFQKAEALYANDIDMFAIFAYVRHGDHINARMFAPLNNIPEDPATGSAAAAFGAFLCQLGGKPLSLTIDQGVDMGRPSRIDVTTEFTNGTCTAVKIGGSALQTMQGNLTYSARGIA